MTTIRLRLVAALLLATLARLVLAAPPQADPDQTKAAPVETQPRRVDRIIDVFHDASNPAVLVVSHRGDHPLWPENSIPAITSCADFGADVVEVDVRKTADGRYVLLHDGTVDRTTNGSGRAEEMTLEQVRALRLVRGLYTVTDLLVPTLEEALEAARGRIMLNIDLKSGDILEIAAIAREMGVLDHLIFKRYWAGLSDQLKRALAEQPDIVFMPQAGTLEEVNAALDHGPKPAFELKFESTEDELGTKAFMTDLRARGARPWANTLGLARNNAGWADPIARINPDRVWGAAIDQGVTMIQTDLPRLLVKYLDHRGLRAAP